MCGDNTTEPPTKTPFTVPPPLPPRVLRAPLCQYPLCVAHSSKRVLGVCDTCSEHEKDIEIHLLRKIVTGLNERKKRYKEEINALTAERDVIQANYNELNERHNSLDALARTAVEAGDIQFALFLLGYSDDPGTEITDADRMVYDVASADAATTTAPQHIENEPVIGRPSHTRSEFDISRLRVMLPAPVQPIPTQSVPIQPISAPIHAPPTFLWSANANAGANSANFQ